jgi:protein-S-isoprenylcysteine O-methyltransferase Ste14
MSRGMTRLQGKQKNGLPGTCAHRVVLICAQFKRPPDTKQSGLPPENQPRKRRHLAHKNLSEEMMENKISRFGIGVAVVPIMTIYNLMTIFLTFYFYPFFKIRPAPYTSLIAAGIVLVTIGIPFWLISVKAVMKAYNANQLVTGGVYGCCRHPLYSSWIFFIIPGISFLLNSWIMLTASVFMYLICRTFIAREEDYLEKAFGSDYLDYKKKVPSFIPAGWIVKN